MNNSQATKRHAAKKEEMQQKLKAGLLSASFPDVANIVVSMIYSQNEIARSIPRTVHFFPDSYAFFRIGCLDKDCVDGGFDLSRILTSMIRNRKKAAKGRLDCEGNGTSAAHSAIAYEIEITYQSRRN